MSDTRDVNLGFEKKEKSRRKFCCGLIFISGQAYLYLPVVRLADRCLSGHQNTRVLPAASNSPISTLEPLVTFQKPSTVACVTTIGQQTRTCLRLNKKIKQNHLLAAAGVFLYDGLSLVNLAAL